MTMVAVDHEVGAVKGVPVLATRLTCLLCRLGLATQYVLSLGDGFHVVRIDARFHLAEMIDREPLLNWSLEYFIGDTVRLGAAF